MARRRHRKMPAFPGDPVHAGQVLRPLRARLLLERRQSIGPQAIDVRAGREVGDEIAVLGRGAGHLGAQRDKGVLDVEGPGREVRGRLREDVRIGVLARGIDVGIGRDDEHDVLGRPVEGDRRQGDRGRGVATHGLEEQGGVRELVADQSLVATLGHDRDVVGQPA